MLPLTDLETSAPDKKRVSFYTLGCKLNYAESSTMGRAFAANGFDIVDFKAGADVVVINTCSVTENADREARKIVRQALRRSPEAFVVVVGCYAQLRPEELASIEGVDLILGSNEKFDVFRYVDGLRKRELACIQVGAIEAAESFGYAYSAEHGNRTRAFLKVQDGCDYTCSFCTIPLARGASRSQSIAATVEQVKAIVANGFREIVLSGVNVGDYGRRESLSLLDLLCALEEIPGDFRVRVSSIEPNLLTDGIIDFVRSSGKMCQHFHVPLQSGSPSILRKMRRRYSVDLYKEKIEHIKRVLPDSGIGIDVIVGFPGESEFEFAETFEFLTELPLSYLHVFSYSERPDTDAAAMPEQVLPAAKAIRSKQLRMLSEKKRRAFYESQLGKTAAVLFEGSEHDGLAIGFTDNYVKVAVPFDTSIVNTLARTQLHSIKGPFVEGRLV